MTYSEELSETIIRGNYWAGYTWTVGQTGTDYTDCIIKSQCRIGPDKPVLFEVDITPDTASNGVCIFSMSLLSENTQKMNSKTVYMDIQIIPVNGNIQTPIKITFNVVQDITK